MFRLKFILLFIACILIGLLSFRSLEKGREINFQSEIPSARVEVKAYQAEKEIVRRQIHGKEKEKENNISEVESLPRQCAIGNTLYLRGVGYFLCVDAEKNNGSLWRKIY